MLLAIISQKYMKQLYNNRLAGVVGTADDQPQALRKGLRSGRSESAKEKSTY